MRNLFLCGIVLLTMAVLCPAQVTIVEFPTPGGSAPEGITTGSDAALWFPEQLANKIGRMTTAGVLTNEYPIPTANSNPDAITAGPDGALWFAEQQASKIGRITTAGAITEYTIPTPGSYPNAITAGPDGALWFTENNGNKVGRITTAGLFIEFPVPSPGVPGPGFIMAGPDGALWFSESGSNKIARITTAGVFTEYPVPTPGSNPDSLTLGTDGALWFTEYFGNKIGRITTAGVITEYAVPTAGSTPFDIKTGPDGALWFTEFSANKVGRITTAGVVTNEYPIPTAGAGITYMSVGPDGSLWLTEIIANQIAKITQSPNPATTGSIAINAGVLPGLRPAAFALQGVTTGDSVFNFTNTGVNVDPVTGAGDICVNTYTFAYDEQLVSCCSCRVTRNALWSLSAQNDLLSNILTPDSSIAARGIVVKFLATQVGIAGVCDPAHPNAPTRGMAAWATTWHATATGVPPVVIGFLGSETPFINSTLSDGERSVMTSYCGFIKANGSGFGICTSCQTGLQQGHAAQNLGLGADKQ